MNCLLVSYTGLGFNSTEHVVAFGCGLARLGWQVRVATNACSTESGEWLFHLCRPDGELEPIHGTARFEPADIVHVWTPRAPIWRFLETHGRLVAGALVLHLEDDEDEVLALYGDGRVPPDGIVSRASLRAMRLEDWAHPDLARCFAHAVDGATILSPELRDKLPGTTPTLHVVPPLSPAWVDPLPPDLAPPPFADGFASVVYAGGLHPAVATDFLDLCTAMRELTRRGLRVRLYRTGPGILPEIREQVLQVAPDFCDLGNLSITAVRDVLARADVLVQPGGPTRFNRRRFPSKLAAYLTSGTPVVMPACYAWTGVKQGEHAITFEHGGSEDLTAAIARVLERPEEARQMGIRASAFARARFDLEDCCRPLDAFYRTLPGRPRIPWSTVKKPRVELPLMMIEAARAIPPWWSLWNRPRPTTVPSALVDAACAGHFRSTLPPPERLTQVAIEELRNPPQAPDQGVAVAQWYWPVPGGYAEATSTRKAFLSGRWRRLNFGPHVVAAGSRPRFDPGNRPGLYEIAAIVYRDEDGLALERLTPDSASMAKTRPNGTIKQLGSPVRPLSRWLGTGEDPQLILPPITRAGIIRVECWIKWTPLD